MTSKDLAAVAITLRREARRYETRNTLAVSVNLDKAFACLIKAVGNAAIYEAEKETP